MRVRDPATVNALANLPGVPELFGVEAFDFTEAIRNEQNIFLVYEGAMAICEWSAPFVYQCHIILAPTCRGRKAVKAVIRMRDFMFDNHAEMLWGQPPLSNVPGRKLIKMVGFEAVGTGFNPLVGETELVLCRRS